MLQIKNVYKTFNPGTVNENIIRFKAVLRWAYQNDFIKDAAIIDKLTPLKDDAKKAKLKDKYLEKEEEFNLCFGGVVRV